MRSSFKQHNPEAGFTFLELMLVLVLVSVLAAVVAPSFSKAMPTLAVRSAARMVFASAQRARSESVARAVRFVLVLDLSEQTLSVRAESDPLNAPGDFEELAEPWAKPVQLPARANVERVTITEDDQSEALTDGECEVLFRPDGTAQDAEIEIVSDSGTEHWVIVRGVTGRVEITVEPPS